jgi:Fe2+ transport system protein B
MCIKRSCCHNVPIIAALYLFLTLLEEVGYMARAAFVMDKYIRHTINKNNACGNIKKVN